MAAESDMADADAAHGRYRAAAAAAAAVVISLAPKSQAPSPFDTPGSVLPPTPPLVTTLPASVDCAFVGEGSANAVFSITPARSATKQSAPARGAARTARTARSQADDADAGPLSTHLLRIPKAGPGVGPGTCLDHQAFYTSVLHPLLGAEWLVGQHLVQGLMARSIQAKLNAILADLDSSGRRRPDWVGSRVSPVVDVGLLVEDMTLASTHAAPSQPLQPSQPSRTTTLQCKPKWLVQSPSAPAGARRCRTCALSAASAPAKHDTGGATHKKAHKIKPCPMVLVADPPTTAAGERDLDAALWDYVYQHMGSAVVSSSSAPGAAPLAPADSIALLKSRPAIVRWLRTTKLFRRMAAIQAEFDPHGVLSIDLAAANGMGTPASLDRLQTAMTLRDCTCFLRVTVPDAGSAPAVPAISAKLGDLDRKDGRHKLARWQAQEQALLDGGFYLCQEEPRQATQCWLERQTF